MSEGPVEMKLVRETFTHYIVEVWNKGVYLGKAEIRKKARGR